MDSKPKSMAQKRARHYNETKTLLSIALIIFGTCSAFCLILLWPQKFLIDVFNSRLGYRLIIDDEDFYTCDSDFISFVVDEPTSDYALLSIYIFNVSNAADVIQRGYNPSLVESGPFGFSKRSYKYNVKFDPTDSTTVEYKEYSYVEAVEDADVCEAMFYRLNRDYLSSDPCSGDTCKCKSIDNPIVVVNPLFLKTVWKETPFKMLGYYSVDPFVAIKNLLEDPFVEAVKAHLAPTAFKEIYQFRIQMQVGPIFQTAIENLNSTYGYSLSYLASHKISSSYSCGLETYGITGCLFSPYDAFPYTSPSILPLLNSSYNYSLVNLEYGLPKWIGLTWYFGYITFNSAKGYSSVTREELSQVYQEFAEEIAIWNYGINNYNSSQLSTCKTMIKSICAYISSTYLTPLSIRTSKLQLLAYQEFNSTYSEVPCNPLGLKCIWQYGFMKHYFNSPLSLKSAVIESLIDLGTEVSTNPNNLYKDSNAELWYNAFLYCNNVNNNDDLILSCTNYAYTYDDALIGQPSGLWGVDNSVSTVNLTSLHNKYAKVSSDVKLKYFYTACNISNLLQNIYRNITNFHDHFVIKYLNKYKDPDFPHNFTLGNWDELGIAQFGGGFVTYALEEVRTIKQIVRNGMWRFGADKYYTYYLEYSSWAVLSGYPYSWIYDIDDSRTLLYALARNDLNGMRFRQHIVYRGSTFIGDGVNYDNGVGDVNDITFTKEANRGDFLCDNDTINQAACFLLNVNFSSSSTECTFVEDLYESCYNQYTYENNKWIDVTACTEFETTTTSPAQGISCDSLEVSGHTHPYNKKRGNIVYSMLYGLTLMTSLREGYWCESVSNCDFVWGGMFKKTTVRKTLFEGFTEPSILKYFDLVNQINNISFECVTSPYDICGVKNYVCDDQGLYLMLPFQNQSSNAYNYSKYLLLYNSTPFDEYFSLEFYYDTSNSRLLFPYSSNSTIAESDQRNLLNDSSSIVTLFNPFWAAFPAWNNQQQQSFLKYFQCQRRLLLGPMNEFESCLIKHTTGRDYLENTLNLILFYGNSTIHPSYFNTSNSFTINGSMINNQYQSFEWSGFKAYPYSYLGESAGVNFFSKTKLYKFSSLGAIPMELSQDTLTYQFQRDITLEVPFTTGDVEDQNPSYNGKTVNLMLPSRRFVEDTTTWDNYRKLMTPKDSYGMKYTTPKGMLSMERFAGFPVFLDTANSYGNYLWGGKEYTQVSGTTQNQYSQRTYVDYDPVTGRAIRSALRHQVTLRVETNSFYPNAFSGSGRCLVPSKSYMTYSGYGCFAYIPILWYEDARIINKRTFYQFYDHFYTRPARGYLLTLAGIVIGVSMILIGLCMFISETYHRKRFQARVYVDN